MYDRRGPTDLPFVWHSRLTVTAIASHHLSTFCVPLTSLLHRGARERETRFDREADRRAVILPVQERPSLPSVRRFGTAVFKRLLGDAAKRPLAKHRSSVRGMHVSCWRINRHHLEIFQLFPDRSFSF